MRTDDQLVVRLVHLSYGLAVILGVIVAILATVTATSLWATPARRASDTE